MRDIKFRAWHKGQNKMYPAEEMGRDELTIATDGRGFVNVSEDGPQFSEYITDMIPLQYTGLKDKNVPKTDIYEGDIIDERGLVIGNIWVDKNVYQEGTHLIVEGMGTRTWRDTEQKAMGRGCEYAE